MKQTSDFFKDDAVIYVPSHANGDRKHPDCERGVVTSRNDLFVFVRYAGRNNSQATRPEDLVFQ